MCLAHGQQKGDSRWLQAGWRGPEGICIHAEMGYTGGCMEYMVWAGLNLRKPTVEREED